MYECNFTRLYNTRPLSFIVIISALWRAVTFTRRVLRLFRDLVRLRCLSTKRHDTFSLIVPSFLQALSPACALYPHGYNLSLDCLKKRRERARRRRIYQCKYISFNVFQFRDATHTLSFLFIDNPLTILF